MNLKIIKSIDTDHFYSSQKSIVLESDIRHFYQSLTNESKKGFPNTVRVYYLEGELFIDSNFEFDLPSSYQAIGDFQGELFSNDENFFTSVDFKDDYFCLNNKYFSFVTPLLFPYTLEHNELISLGDYILTIQAMDSEAAKKILDFNRRVHHANNSGVLNDFESNNSKSENEILMNKIITGEELVFKTQLVFLNSSYELLELKAKNKLLCRSLSLKECRPIVETHAQSAIFRGVHPEGDFRMQRDKIVHSSYLQNMIPYCTDEIHERGDTLWSVHNRPVFFDLFDKNNINFNAVISGNSGQGKSVLAQMLLQGQLKEGRSSVIIDKGGSFERMVKYYDGVSFKGKFNPFQFKSPSYLKAFILSCLPAGELSYRDECLLHSAIVEALQSPLVENFKELIAFIENHIKGISIYFNELWEFFSDDTYEFYNLAYFDLDNFPEKVISPLLVFAIEYFSQFQGQKVLFLDECWALLKDHADYVEEKYRTFRKHGASAISMSQAFDDFVSSEIGSVIANCSFHKFFFKQNIEKSKYLKQEDVDLVLSCNSQRDVCSEFFYLNDSEKRKKLRYFASHEELTLFNSDFSFKAKFDSFCEDHIRYINYKEVVDKWVREYC